MTMTDLQQQDLWVAGSDGFHTYRIPALTVTTAGTVLAFCEGRRFGRGDSGEIHLLLRRSHDDGKTWGDVTTITADSGYTRGNPAPVVDRTTGTVHLVYTQNPADRTEKEINAGHGERTVWITRSTDDGMSWTAPLEITAQVKDPAWTWYATGPGHGIQLRSGRLLVPCDHRAGVVRHDDDDVPSDRAPYRSHVIYSDDVGRSWAVGGVLPGGTNESTATELSDGRVYLNARNADGPKLRGYAYSDDGGTTFGDLAWHPDLVDPTCQGSVLDGPDGSVIFSNAASQSRDRLTVRSSDDHGQTWSAGVVLSTAKAAYSDLARTDDGHLLCLYEYGDETPYEGLRLARMPLSSEATP